VSGHLPVGLEERPGDDHRSLLVFATRDLAHKKGTRLCAGVNAIAAPPSCRVYRDLAPLPFLLEIISSDDPH
jgi:hypothetical protein